MNRQLTPKEKRTIRIAAAGVVIYLAVLYGSSIWGGLGSRRDDYNHLVQQARDLRDVIKPYQERIETASNLMARFKMDPVKLKRATVMAEASAAIQQAASSQGLEAGPIRETPGRASAKEAGSIQFEGSGQIAGVMKFLHQLDGIGYPVVIDTIQFGQDPSKPDGVKVTMTVIVFDFDAWKPKQEAPHV